MNKVTFDKKKKKHTIYDSIIIIKHAESSFQLLKSMILKENLLYSDHSFCIN